MIKALKHLDLKLLAVLASIILWLFVITVENTVSKFPEKIDVKIINSAENLTLMENIPPVEIYLRVDESKLKTLTKNDFEIFIDLSDYTAGEHKIKVEGRSTDSSVKILKISPEEVNVKLSPQAEKDIEVELKINGEPSEGYSIGSTRMEEDIDVKIIGAQVTLEQVDKLVAKLILEGNETGDFKQNVKLELPTDIDIEPGLIKIVPEQITVNVNVTAEIREKIVKVSPKFVREADRISYQDKIIIEPKEVTIRGDLKTLNEYEFIETEIIEVSVLLRQENLTRKLVVPKGLTLDPTNQTVTITLKK